MDPPMALTVDEFVAMAAQAEAGDPSSRGHQHRVGEMAAAIASELGLDAESVENIRIAGLLHDIGKTVVHVDESPTRGSLTLAQWEMIKEHCQIGYEILVDSAVAAQVAEMVLQHHERCDGSGYPAGLRQEEISIGARILAVADSVEDEASHPPVGVENGLEFALDSIRHGRGTLFDRNAVTACLRLDHERRLPIDPKPAAA